MHIIGLKAALNSCGTYKYKVTVTVYLPFFPAVVYFLKADGVQSPDGIIDHLVIGGGVVGLAIARLLSTRFPEKSTYLVERNGRAGEETSSRNSEVIHAGLYYPSGSLKESLCLRGRELLYRYCDTASVPYKKTGKLIVAHENERCYIETLHQKAKRLQWPRPILSKDETTLPIPVLPTELITGDQAREMEPDLSPDITAALLSHETGIIDSHSLMSSLEQDIMESENAEPVYSTTVVRIDPYKRSNLAENIPDMHSNLDGWVIQMVTQNGDGINNEPDALLARSVINSSGLSGNLILNSLLPIEERIPMYYARGSYAAYAGPGVGRVSRLIYPCPDTGTKSSSTFHKFQGLGTHLTFDLAHNIKFGPDVEWISPSGTKESGYEDANPEPSYSFKEDDVDFWKRYLIPNSIQLEEICKAVTRYLPNVDPTKFRADYVGIRPKLVPPWGGFQDFVFRKDYSGRFLGSVGRQAGIDGVMITLMGIESPGLTSSLAIAEHVVAMLESSD